MRLSEPVTIYLAIGASFGASHYLCAASLTKSHLRAFAEGMATTLLWPLAAAAILMKRLRHKHWKDASQERDGGFHSRVEEDVRAFAISVNKMLETIRAQGQEGSRLLEQTLYAVRESAEQYAWLAMIEAYADEAAPPAPHEAELARVSGRRGEDLMVAARCVHRRNVSRIKAHYQRERSRLLKKLSELRAQDDAASCVRDDNFRAKLTKVVEARLEIYLRAADLFSLLEDERAVRGTAKLIEAERLTLRQLREVEEAAAPGRHGEERCMEQPPQLILKDQPRATTFTQG